MVNELGAAERMFSRPRRGGGTPTCVTSADSDWVPSKHLIHEQTTNKKEVGASV